MRQSTARDTIIATASRLFYQNGYNNTGINKIIREAGIAKAT
ncbi:MAG: helix-turn-helix domain-containing protein, partial [Bacteroidota bacterium]